MLRELAGSQDPAPQLAGQLFNSRGEIDGRTDTGEVKAIPAADIAVEDIANVQGQAEAQPGHGRARKFGDICPRLTCGEECPLTHLRLVVGDRKNCRRWCASDPPLELGELEVMPPKTSSRLDQPSRRPARCAASLARS